MRNHFDPDAILARLARIRAEQAIAAAEPVADEADETDVAEIGARMYGHGSRSNREAARRMFGGDLNDIGRRIYRR